MIDTNKLRGRIIEKFGSARAFAEEICMNEATLSRKLNNELEFRYDEVIKISEYLDIKPEEIGPYFYSLKRAT